MTIFEGKNIRISWDAKVECVVSEMEGFAEGEEYRNALEKGLESLELNRSRKWLGDMTRGSLMSQDDAKWVQADWRPRAARAGLRWTALVMTNNALGKMQIDRMTRTVAEYEGSSIETAYFDNQEEAKAWLQSQG